MSLKFTQASALVGAGLLVALTGVATAQQPSVKTSTEVGQATTSKSTQTINAEVVSVDGNKVVGRDASGATREYTVPEGFKFQTDGHDIGVADLKPGMKVSATITTTTTVAPVTVTEIRKGSVLQVLGTTIIVRGPAGVRKFTQEELDKRHIKLIREGQPAQISDFRDGDVFTAVIITDKPPQVVSEREAKAYAKGAPAPAPARAAAPAPAPAPAPAAAAPAPAPAPAKKLPKTASQVPLVGLMGAFSLAAGLGLSLARRRSR